jgi:carbamoyltransferase
MMRTAVVGIGAFVHDTASCLIDSRDGRVLYALAEERLTDVKHDTMFPIGSLRQALQAAESGGYTVTDVAVSHDPELFLTGTLARIVREIVPDQQAANSLLSRLVALHYYPDYYLLSGYSFATSYVERLIADFDISAPARLTLRRRLSWHYNWAVKYRLVHTYCQQVLPQCRLHAVPHHTAHAASALYGCGFPEATILVADGQGESDTVSIFSADADGMRLVGSSAYPFSLGLFYLACTQHLGFSLGDEYKVMGMAAYGQPSLDELLAPLFDVTKQGGLRLHENEYFSPNTPEPNTGLESLKFNERFCTLVPRRDPQAPIEQIHFDFAASVQRLTERIGVQLARAAISLTGKHHLVLTGGVALNGLMNERIRRESGCTNLFVYPAAGDDGSAVGAAQHVATQNGARPAAAMRTCFFGNAAGDADILSELTRHKIKYAKPDDMAATIAVALARGKIVARFVGRSEFGPRALGNRSILADPRHAGMRDVLNARIKHRENFRPFAPACLRERASEYFDLDCESPFMLLICPVKDKARAEIPAVVHADGTARVQTVDRDANPDFYRLIAEFDRITGTPVVVNTSFNVNGETIVETAADAIESFLFMNIDYLAIHDYWISKAENAKRSLSSLPHDEYLALRRKRFAQQYAEPLSQLDLARFNAAFFHDAALFRGRGVEHDPQPYSLGRKLSFAQSGAGTHYQLAGWSDPESWGTWSVGPAASLEIPLADGLAGLVRMTCMIQAFVTQASPEQVVHVAVNGEVVDRWVFRSGGVPESRQASVPARLLIGQRSLRIDFLIRNARSPLELNMSDDSRQLGIGILDLILENAD